jgi:hypothetical protein
VADGTAENAGGDGLNSRVYALLNLTASESTIIRENTKYHYVQLSHSHCATGTVPHNPCRTERTRGSRLLASQAMLRFKSVQRSRRRHQCMARHAVYGIGMRRFFLVLSRLDRKRVLED